MNERRAFIDSIGERQAWTHQSVGGGPKGDKTFCARYGLRSDPKWGHSDLLASWAGFVVTSSGFGSVYSLPRETENSLFKSSQKLVEMVQFFIGFQSGSSFF